MKQAGKTQSEIAQAIGFSQSAIRKELSRNHGERGDRPAQAERLAKERKSQKRTPPKVMVGIIKDEVEARLRIKHNPDQISKSLALLDLKVSHEEIYQYIAADRKAGGDLSLNLRNKSRRHYRRRSQDRAWGQDPEPGGHRRATGCYFRQEALWRLGGGPHSRKGGKRFPALGL